MSERVGTCSLCRVPSTEEHQGSEFHAYNVDLQDQGKMPLSEELFHKYEANKGRTKVSADIINTAAATTPAATVPAVGHMSPIENKLNANNWHWEERNIQDLAHMTFKKVMLETQFLDVDFCQLAITNVKKIEGDCDVCMRKGKKRLGFQLTASLEWKGFVNGADGE